MDYKLERNNAVTTSDSCANKDISPHSCSVCKRPLVDTEDDFLQCQKCQCTVHIKCLRHASTPGDLLGDVFFDYTCCQCSSEPKYDPGPSTSSNAAREQLVRQKLPWLIVIALALHNLSIKSKGLSHHGYFHWRTHIVSFIDKNWEYLFEPMTRRRKKWIGSVSGSLSHNSPEFFMSGQDVFHETGWWKLTHTNHTPKLIFKLYEQLSLKRQQLRNDKRVLEDNNHTNDNPNAVLDVESKKMRRLDSDEDIPATDSCSRTIPYMGRKPKVAKQLNIVDVDINKTLQQQQQPLNTVQTSLMDFLAENLTSEDLMFQDLPNIAPEPIISLGKNDDLLPLISSSVSAHQKNIEHSFFEMPNVKEEMHESNGYELTATNTSTTASEDVDGKLKSFYLYQEQQQQQLKHNLLPTFANDDCVSENISTISTNDSNNLNDEDDSNDDEFQPRIVQVTNFQQIECQAAPPPNQAKTSPKKTGKKIKKEIKSEPDESDNDDAIKIINNSNGYLDHTTTFEQLDDNDDASSSTSENAHVLAPCKAGLFTKRTQRDWPWLVQKEPEQDTPLLDHNASLVMMSEYEEKELLHKLRKIFGLEEKCKIDIPAYVRRFYRKLCVRAWKREHSKPLFNLDDYCDATRKLIKYNKAKTEVIDRFQLLALSSSNSRSSFYARIAGSFQYEVFESPYSQRILHPFIYRNTQCFPPWLKLMCEIQYAVNGTLPTRATVDFCYVRPNHIAAVNALLQTVFWPGIDMSECLSYPDFSVVALYKKLVVGCGFLVPDVGFNEAYISFMAVRPGWQRSGIATFMLYHLIQTCMSKDITLHVSATNPAVMLYQKFGFKIEEVILDFYEKYLPLDSKHSRHAFFLRLMR